MLVDFCQREQATVIVRGLRAITDFENEMAIAHTNDTLAGIDTVFFPTRCRHSFVASSIVKEIAIHNTATGWAALSQYCPENVIEALRKKYDKTWTDQQESK
jgi:pantetheine-phosphate adenylyltransferase